MSRILLAWELGGSYGHISILLPLALRLREQGHEVLFALREIKTVSQLLEDQGFAFVQAPFIPAIRQRYREPLSFTDILHGAGFGDMEVLAALVAGWHNIYKLYSADTIIGEYAPIAMFTARLAGLPCLHLNTGFGFPPDSGIFPCFRPWRKPTREQLIEREQIILAHFNAVRARHGLAGFASLQMAIKADVDLLVTLPELDHYQRRDTRQMIGPIVMSDMGVEMKWPEEGTPRIFVYLQANAEIKMVLETLKNRRAGVIAFIPGIDDALKKTYTNDHLRIVSSMVKLSSLLPDMDLAIAHSGHGTAALMLLSGVPMLLFPTTIEQWMLSRVLTKHGMGREVKKESEATRFPQSLEILISDENYRNKAGQLARKYRSFDSERVLNRLTTTIERLPEWKQKNACK